MNTDAAGAASVDEKIVQRLADLQTTILPQSMISRIGIEFVREFYRFACHSSKEIVLWKANRGEVIGGCVVSLRPRTLSWRLLFRTTLLFRLARLPLRLLLSELTPSDGAVKGIGEMPELILLFTRSDKRSQGIGMELVNECEDKLARRGILEYCVKTFDAEDNRAIRFYLRAGFVERGRGHIHGERFCFLSKKIQVTAPR